MALRAMELNHPIGGTGKLSIPMIALSDSNVQNTDMHRITAVVAGIWIYLIPEGVLYVNSSS